MPYESDEKLSMKFAWEIDHLIELQFQQEPFTEMNLSSSEILRAETCLAIYNLAYFIYFMNKFYVHNPEKIKFIIDTTYNEFFNNFKQKHSYTDIIISEIVVNPKEQIEIIRISRSWGIDYHINAGTLLHNLFPFIYEYRIPIYLKAINESLQNAEKDLAFPFFPVVRLFCEQLFKERITGFHVKFDMIINLETFGRISELVNNTLKEALT